MTSDRDNQRRVDELMARLTPRERVEYSDLGARYATFPESHLYVARQVGTTTPVKIGRSINVTARIRSIQAAAKLELVATVPEWAFSEAEAHARFHAQRQHGEWFALTDDMQAWIDGLPALVPPAAVVRRRILAVLGRNEDGSSAPDAPRPLAHLQDTEHRLKAIVQRREAERLRQLARLERERQSEERRRFAAQKHALGCALCRRVGVTVAAVKGRDFWACSSCNTWLKRYNDAREDALCEAEEKAGGLRRQADAIEELARRRLDNLAASERHERLARANSPEGVPTVDLTQ